MPASTLVSQLIKDPGLDPTASSTVTLIPGHPPGYCVQRNLFYASETWSDVVRPDVDALLSTFEERWIQISKAATLLQQNNSKNSTKTGGANHSKQSKRKNGHEFQDSQQGVEQPKSESNNALAHESSLSPFALFKEVWIELGWSRIHLVAVLDGPMRRPWSESVTRVFLENVKPVNGESVSTLRQAAAFFALYTFWSTQPRTMEQFFISVDPPTLEHILEIPNQFPASSPKSTTEKASVQHANETSMSGDPLSLSALHVDLLYVLHALITRSSFFVIPSEAYQWPALPSVSIRDAKEETHKETAKLVIGLSDELNEIKHGRVSLNPAFTTASSNVDRSDQFDERFEVLASNTAQARSYGWDDTKGWGGDLKDLQSSYVDTKKAILSATNSHLLPSKRSIISVAEGNDEVVAPARPNELASNASTSLFARQILASAQTLTLGAVAKLPNADQILPELDGQQPGALIDLVSPNESLAMTSTITASNAAHGQVEHHAVPAIRRKGISEYEKILLQLDSPKIADDATELNE